MAEWPDHFIVRCVGDRDDPHDEVEIFRLDLNLSTGEIRESWRIDYIIGESTKGSVNRRRRRNTTDVWRCQSCDLSIRMEHLDPRRRNLIVDSIEAGHLEVLLPEWIEAYHSQAAARRYRRKPPTS